ncbi:MAG TPA: LPS assembly lipoprotein LptE [Bryobacteraceae bacterium]|nr:LPS assembly lipoprotein LptE [Bryobacteraceae bacterium]
MSFAPTWRIAAAVPALMLAGCGYHIAGKANLLPDNIHTIAVAPWGNISVRYRLSNYLAASVSRELVARTRYRLVTDVSKADVVLYGSIANMLQGGSPLYDNATGRTTAGNVVVYLQFRLVDRSGKTLIDKPGLVYQQPYEISTDPRQYFDESEAAFQRLSTDVAKSVVSAMLEQF